MSEIPKWPAGQPILNQANGDFYEHEHAVAKVAVAALKNISVYAAEDHDGMTYQELSDYAAEIVREIEASGWQP